MIYLVVLEELNSISVSIQHVGRSCASLVIGAQSLSYVISSLPIGSNLRYLMRSRVGRCGEFAGLFALFIRAVGLRGRYGKSI
jgi:hypothetical protein